MALRTTASRPILARGYRAELRGDGRFEGRPRPARIRRNPRSQAEVEVAPSAAVRLKPAKVMKDRFNPERADGERETGRRLRAS